MKREKKKLDWKQLNPKEARKDLSLHYTLEVRKMKQFIAKKKTVLAKENRW